MPNLNLIKPKQLDPSIVDFVKGITSGDIGSSIGAYVITGWQGPNVLSTTGGIQTVDGQKTFILPINVPYSGNNNQTVSKLYIIDQLAAVQGQILQVVPSGLLHVTGNEAAQGIKTFDSIVINQGITGASSHFTTSNIITTALVPNVNLASSPDSHSAVNLSFYYGQTPVFTTGFQSISDYKEFLNAPSLLNIATGQTQAIRLSQLVDSGNWLQTQINALVKASGTQISGFGGVLSFNGQSGSIFALGRGTTTVFQQGNITFISGSLPILSGSGTYLLQGEQGLLGPYLVPKGTWNTGISYGYLNFVTLSGNAWAATTGHFSTNTNIPGANNAPWQLLAIGTGQTGAWQYRGNYNSSTTYIFNNAIGYNGSTYGFSGTSSIGLLAPTGSGWYTIAQSGTMGSQGIQGNVGATGATGAWQYRGIYASGTIYRFNDAISYNGGAFGYSGTPSSGFLAPTGLGWYTIVPSGSIGPIGSTGAWKFRGNYLGFKTYVFNDAVAYKGSTYGYSGNSSQGAAPDTGLFWDLLAKSGEVGTSGLTGPIGPTGLTGPTGAWKYRGNYLGFKTYLFNDAITYHGQTWGFSGDSINGVNPETTGVGWDLLAASGGQGATGAWRHRGTFSSATNYIFNDAVTFVGSTYGCAASLSFGLNAPTGSDWYIVAQSGSIGSGAWRYRGTFNAGTVYSKNDSVVYGGASYGLVSAVNSGLLAPTGFSWNLIAASGAPGAWQYSGAYNPAITYTSNNAASYNGSTYGYSGTVGSLGITPDTGSGWYLIAQSGASGATIVGPTGAWQYSGAFNSTTNYFFNNAVTYIGSTYGYSGTISSGFLAPTGLGWYIIAQSGTTGLQGLQGVQGLSGVTATGAWQYSGTWVSNITYRLNNAVQYGGATYGFSGSPSSIGAPPNTGSGWYLIAASGSQGVTGATGATGPVGNFINSGTITGNFTNLSFFLDFPYTGLYLGEAFISQAFYFYRIRNWMRV
jgi:collagen type VII alpha